MSKEQEVFEIADTAFKRVAKLVAKLSIEETGKISFDSETSSLVATTVMDGDLITMVLCASNRVLRAITSSMKHHLPLVSGDMEAYTAEFFNMICGNIITIVNDTFNISVGLAIPSFQKGEYSDITIPERTKKELLYESGNGPISLQFFYKSPLFHLGKTSVVKKGDSHMNKRVLVVDDSIFIYQEISYLLKGSGFEICAYAKSGEEALSLYEKYTPDIITIDIILPGMDGIETAKKIIKRWPEAKIIMVSSLAYQNTIDESTSAGACDFIFKPFNKARLLSALLGAVDTSMDGKTK